MDPNPYKPPSATVADHLPEGVVEVTWERAAKVWWSLLWRAVLFGGVAGGVFGAIVGGIMGASGASLEQIATVTKSVGILVGIPVGIWVTRSILRKSWSDFRIVLVAVRGS